MNKKGKFDTKKKKYKKFCTKTAQKQLIAKMTNKELHILYCAVDVTTCRRK